MKDMSILSDFISASPFISDEPKYDSIWKDYDYDIGGMKLCVDVLSNHDFNDTKILEDFLIENDFKYMFIGTLCDKVTKFSSIYRIALNCKSNEVRKLFKNKLKYHVNNRHNRRSRDDGDAEHRAAVGLGALFR